MLAVVLIPAAACREAPGEESAGTPDAAEERPRPQPVHVDSIRPLEEELRRFQASLGERPARLEGGVGSRRELVRRFVRALEARDTVALARMAVTRAEFGHLYYPSSRYTEPPYELSPAFLWFQLQNKGNRGISRALRAYDGRSLAYTGHRCDPEPLVQGKNLVWTGCSVRLAPAADPALHGPDPPAGARDSSEVRLFGPILEREGAFKFLSYSNSL